MKTINQEAKRIPIIGNVKQTTPRHIMIKMLKTSDKENILKTVREKKKCRKQIMVFTGNTETRTISFKC